MRPLYSLDRDVFAEKAATLLRKTRDIDAVCKALDIRRPALRDLANDYGIPWSVYEHTSPQWPSRDDEGDGSGHWHRRWRIENHRRAQRAAREALKGFPALPPPSVKAHILAPAPCQKVEVAPPPPEPKNLTRSASIIRDVCIKHHVTKSALFGQGRAKKLCAARHEAVFRMVTEAHLSLPSIGRILGGRDHTTALNSVRAYLATHPEAKPVYAEFIRQREQQEAELRAEVIRLHFDEGKTFGAIVKRLKVSRIRMLPWLLDEAKRREMKMAA